MAQRPQCGEKEINQLEHLAVAQKIGVPTTKQVTVNSCRVLFGLSPAPQIRQSHQWLNELTPDARDLWKYDETCAGTLEQPPLAEENQLPKR